MIEDDKQLGITLGWIGEFERNLEQAKRVTPPDGVDPVIWDAHVAGMQSQLETMRRQVAEYRARRA